MAKFKHVHGDIEARAQFIHNGSVEIIGNIDDGATIIVNKGALIIRGDVGDNVTIKTSHKRQPLDLQQSLDVRSMPYYAQADIRIDGNVGTRLNIQTNGSLLLKRPAGTYMKAIVRGNVIAPYIDHFSTIDAGMSVQVTNTGNCVELTSDGVIAIENLGHRSIAKAVSIRIDEVDSHCNIIADSSATLGSVAHNVYIKTADEETGDMNKRPMGKIKSANITGNRSAEHPHPILTSR